MSGGSWQARLATAVFTDDWTSGRRRASIHGCNMGSRIADGGVGSRDGGVKL